MNCYLFFATIRPSTLSSPVPSVFFPFSSYSQYRFRIRLVGLALFRAGSSCYPADTSLPTISGVWPLHTCSGNSNLALRPSSNRASLGPRVLLCDPVTINSLLSVTDWPQKSISKDCIFSITHAASILRNTSCQVYRRRKMSNNLSSNTPQKKPKALYFVKVHLLPQFGILKKINSNLNSHWR